jgi:hypothetical protein
MPFSLYSYGKKPTCTTVVQDIASVYQPHSGLLPPHPPKNTNYSIRVYDFMDLACPTQCDSWTKMTWKRLIAEDSEFKAEIKFTMVYLKLQNVTLSNLKLQNVTLSNTKKRRFRQTPVMTLEGLQGLLVILGGKVAADFRQIVEGTFTRYMAGDTSMIEEIRSNAASSAPIHQAYRQALAQEPETDTTNTKAYT